jgi:hypothetical protein
MKKQLLCLAAALAFTASYAAHVAPIRTMTIPFAATPMVMDGVDDEAAWSTVQSTDAFNPTGSTGADADFTLTFKVAYDLNYLYVFANILDDYESDWDWGGANQWTFDNVELFVDLDTNGSGLATAYDSNTYQLRWNRGVDSVGNDCGRLGNTVMRPMHQYYWENTADGWLFESAIAWKFVLGLGQVTEDIMQYIDGTVFSGFDISGADSDTDGQDHRDCQTAWDNDEPQTPDDRTEDNAWNNRSVFGVVDFAPCTTCTGITDYSAITAVAYPNPTTGLVTFANVQGTTVDIMNLAGQVVMTSDINNVNISNLPAGIYVARIGSDNVRLIKE